MQAAKVINEYAPTTSLRERMAQVNGKQEGDTKKAALVVLPSGNNQKPTLRRVQTDLDNWSARAENVVVGQAGVEDKAQRAKRPCALSFMQM